MLGPVSISIPTLLVELVIFVLMVSVMESLVFTPIRRTWAERERMIQEGLAASGRSREEAQRAQDEVQRILAEARQQAQRKIDEGTAAGNRIRDELIAEATQEFRRIVDEARAGIASEREQSAGELERRIVDIALQAAGKVTGQSYERPEVRELAAAIVQRQGMR